LVLIGTPGAILAGPFYEITTGKGSKDHGTVRFWSERESKKRATWSVHSWTAEDNTACPWIWAEYDDEGNLVGGALFDKQEAGWDDDHPTWLREYRAKWVPDDSALVYAYARAKEQGKCDFVADE